MCKEISKRMWYCYMYFTTRTGWTIGILGFDSRRELGIFLFTTASRPVEAHPPFYSMGTEGSSPRVKRPGREADPSSPVKSAWSYTSTP